MRLYDIIKPEFDENTYPNSETNPHLPKAIKLVEPNSGKIITFQINADDSAYRMYVDQIVTLANILDSKITMSGKTVTIDFANLATAESIRETWNHLY